MPTKKPETKTEKLEREYIIPLRKKYQHVARYKKTPKAVKTIKEFLVKHMKIYDRDLNKIKIDKYLNEYLWFRGIKNPPHKIKVKATKEGDIVKVELVDYPDKLKFKKAREEKQEKEAAEAVEKKKTLMQKMKETKEVKPDKKSEIPSSPEDKSSDERKKETKTEEEKKEEKEKAKAGAEQAEKTAKQEAKKAKHQVGGKTKQPKRQQRVALQK